MTSNSLKDNSIKSPKNSYFHILMGQSLYTLFTITLCPSGFVTKMSYSVSLLGKFPMLGMLVHTYEWVDPGSINACTIVSKTVKLPTITSGVSVSYTAFIAYALAGARPSCLAKLCVPCLGTLGDATLLLPLGTNETLPPVWGTVKGRAYYTLVFCAPWIHNPSKHQLLSNNLPCAFFHNGNNEERLIL